MLFRVSYWPLLQLRHQAQFGFLSDKRRQRPRLPFPASLALQPALTASSPNRIPPPFLADWPFPLLPRTAPEPTSALVACCPEQPMGRQSACADSNGGSGKRLGARFGGTDKKAASATGGSGGGGGGRAWLATPEEDGAFPAPPPHRRRRLEKSAMMMSPARGARRRGRR